MDQREPSKTVYPARFAAVLSLFVITACCPVDKKVLGDPQNPYPLKTPPKVGEIQHQPTGTLVTPAQMLAVAGDMRIVYVGETHNNPASHRLELQVLKGLEDLHSGQLVLGMEMFARSQQPALDRWVAGKLDEKTFLKESLWYDNWKMNFAYYRDLLNFARDRRIPVIALNAEKSLVRALRSKPLEHLTSAEQAQLPELDLTDPYQRAFVTAIFGGHAHGSLVLDGFIRAQTLWDETMAESVALYLQSPAGKGKHMVVIAGSDHMRNGFGIPRRAFRRLPVSYVIIGDREIEIPADLKAELMNVELPDFPMVPYDFLAFLEYEKLPGTGVRLGVRIERAPTGGGLVVKEVLPGSNAERAGLKLGDLLFTFDGEPLEDNLDLIYAVERKHPGNRGILQVERQGKTFKVDVLFDAAGKGGSKENPR